MGKSKHTKILGFIGKSTININRSPYKSTIHIGKGLPDLPFPLFFVGFFPMANRDPPNFKAFSECSIHGGSLQECAVNVTEMNQCLRTGSFAGWNISHGIHLFRVFTYMKTIKINQM